MRRLLALATLLVLSLSRFGAPAPRHASTWVLDRVERELGAAMPGARMASVSAREQAQRAAPRSAAPWLPVRGAPVLVLAGPLARLFAAPSSRERASSDEWHRFTYDATAPPRLP